MSGWISAQERFPEDGQNVLICLLTRSIWIGYYNSSKGRWGLGANSIRGSGMVPVTHWMPLPERPK